MSLGKMDDLVKLGKQNDYLFSGGYFYLSFERNVCPLDDIQARVMDENER